MNDIQRYYIRAVAELNTPAFRTTVYYIKCKKRFKFTLKPQLLFYLVGFSFSSSTLAFHTID